MYEGRLLLRRSILEELLYDVISEYVRHEAVGGREDLVEDGLLVVGRGALQLLLDEARSVLILGEFDHVAGQLAKLDIRIPIVSAKKTIN